MSVCYNIGFNKSQINLSKLNLLRDDDIFVRYAVVRKTVLNDANTLVVVWQWCDALDEALRLCKSLNNHSFIRDNHLGSVIVEYCVKEFVVNSSFLDV